MKIEDRRLKIGLQVAGYRFQVGRRMVAPEGVVSDDSSEGVVASAQDDALGRSELIRAHVVRPLCLSSFVAGPFLHRIAALTPALPRTLP